MPNMGLYRRAPAPKRVERLCKQCGQKFSPRAVDVARGWGLFCNKGCKAVYQSGHARPRQQPKPNKPAAAHEVEHAAVQSNFDEWDRICAQEDALLTQRR